jgi:hypothetical protein
MKQNLIFLITCLVLALSACHDGPRQGSPKIEEQSTEAQATSEASSVPTTSEMKTPSQEDESTVSQADTPKESLKKNETVTLSNEHPTTLNATVPSTPTTTREEAPSEPVSVKNETLQNSKTPFTFTLSFASGEERQEPTLAKESVYRVANMKYLYAQGQVGTNNALFLNRHDVFLMKTDLGLALTFAPKKPFVTSFMNAGLTERTLLLTPNFLVDLKQDEPRIFRTLFWQKSDKIDIENFTGIEFKLLGL